MPKQPGGREKYPLLNAYGTDHTFLSTEEAIGADAEARIRSIWPFIVGRVMAFHDTLRPREKVNFDPEDVLGEVWITLAEKNGEWEPERGKYITFAGVIIDRALCSIRERSRTVHSPRNTSGRLNEYKAEEATGELTERRRKTAGDIRRTSDGIGTIPTVADHDTGFERAGWKERAPADPSETVVADEARAQVVDAVRKAVRLLPAFEATVVGRTAGLWGRCKITTYRVAWETGRPEHDIKAARHRAFGRMRRTLVDLDHPATRPTE